MTDLTPYAVKAYETKLKTGYTANPHIRSAPSWYAHELGIYLASRGQTMPRDVRMSRGYSLRANGMLFKIHDTKESISFERIN